MTPGVAAKAMAITPVSNGAKDAIEMKVPYECLVTVKGVAPLIMHAWNVEAQEQKANESKGSRGKKTDDLESYVYRNEKGEICLRGTYMQGAILKVARYHQDPRSPRKMAVDLCKEAIVPLDDLVSLGTKEWNYVLKCRMVVMRAGITRSRPAFNIGWQATFKMLVQLPEYVSPELLHHLIEEAGRLAGMGDSRPTYGRFMITQFKVNPLTSLIA